MTQKSAVHIYFVTEFHIRFQTSRVTEVWLLRQRVKVKRKGAYVPAVSAYRWSAGIAPLILTLAGDGNGWTASPPAALPTQCPPFPTE